MRKLLRRLSGKIFQKSIHRHKRHQGTRSFFLSQNSPGIFIFVIRKLEVTLIHLQEVGCGLGFTVIVRCFL
ncbi:MAG: hypothetical protein A2X86_19615 [Bdellovibrionales bacterium GWA2_49_15]|nr:MAG: hypothetical protein A2X86_19615 [Bdellovibrionales bacterium GWA2_49_15]HAZ13800.1 hypothetical protein [Bdellovibrionales bacterium]